METTNVQMQRVLKSLREDGFDLNAMPENALAPLLLDRLEGRGYLVITAPLKREELPASFPEHLGKNHIGVLACMMDGFYQYTDIGNIRVRWGIPVDERGDIELLVRLGLAERDPRSSRDSARITDLGRKIVQQARAHGYKREPHWCAMAG
jgi:hypothetical protein